jgi:hypothetical protein
LINGGGFGEFCLNELGQESFELLVGWDEIARQAMNVNLRIVVGVDVLFEDACDYLEKS